MLPRSDDDFARILLADVNAAISRRNSSDNQATRRDLVRTVFAAIDGLVVWAFREIVIETADSTYGLKDDEAAVLSEVVYVVNGKGKISSRNQHLPLAASIRLLSRIANRINENTEMDFSCSDWTEFQHAIEVRNRITHPKSQRDLHLSRSDADKALNALFWLLDQQLGVKETLVSTQKAYLGFKLNQGVDFALKV